MSLKADFELMARYNQWMNGRLYEAAATLEPADLQADRGAFFGSLLATLHHILVADTLWMKRFAAHPAHFAGLDGVRAMPMPTPVTGITFPDFRVLRDDRQRMDAAITALCAEADDTAYAKTLHYANSAGESFAKPFGLLLRHFFNHQTHHRGQATTLFSQFGVDVGATDLSVLIPEVDG